MLKIGVIGSIGVGKSTFVSRLTKKFKELGINTKVYGEPAMEDPKTHEILLNFYKDTKAWAYELEASVTARHNVIYKEIDTYIANGEKGITLVDAPSSGDIYSRIFHKNEIFNYAQLAKVMTLFEPFHLDIMIYLIETPEETIRRIMKRDRDMEMNNLNYIYDHVRDYQTFAKDFLIERFPHTKVVKINGLPDADKPEFDEQISKIAMALMLERA